MPPRKTPTADGEELAPRRSTRISSQSGVEAPKETETKATSKAKPAAKRSAEDDSESSSKKVHNHFTTGSSLALLASKKSLLPVS